MSNDLALLENPPLLEYFHITGLHKRKDIRFSTTDSASILMARNGSGKTTLLAAINAILTSRFYKLLEFSFEMIEFKIKSCEKLTIRREDIETLNRNLVESPISKFALECSVSLDYVMDVAQSVRSLTNPNRYQQHEGLQELYNRHPTMTHRPIYEILMQNIEAMYSDIPILAEADSSLRAALEGYDVVYLPTYRRIEMSLNRYQIEHRHSAPWEEPSRRNVNLLPSEIKFGLSDITDRIQEIFLDIQRKSNTTYQKISANIINELLDGSYTEASSSGARPDRDELELFFNRIRASRVRSGAQIAIPDIDKIYSEDLDPGAKPFLLYFLSNLNEAIKSTKPLEDKVNGFLVACNNYLSDADASAFKGSEENIGSVESKKIKVNRSNFRPHFTSGAKETPISIDALSSGEKQVVSLFARLYLYDKRKIILFDEPELSLSIGWQAKLLPDLCRAPGFAQLIAITHSPFIFDNELDKYAGNLEVESHLEAVPELDLQHLPDDDEDGFEDEESSKGSLF
jgi:predicted ATPase